MVDYLMDAYSVLTQIEVQRTWWRMQNIEPDRVLLSQSAMDALSKSVRVGGVSFPVVVHGMAVAPLVGSDPDEHVRVTARLTRRADV